MPLDFSIGGDAIISNKKIKTIQDLRGKIIGVEQGWVSHFFLNYVLAKENLSTKDVVIKDIKASDMGKELILDNIQAASVQEPWLTKIREYAEVNTLKTTRDFDPLVYAVLLVRKDVLKDKKEYFDKFKNAWLKSVNNLYDDTANGIRSVAPYLGLSEIELAEQLQNIEFRNIDKDFNSAIAETKKLLNL